MFEGEGRAACKMSQIDSNEIGLLHLISVQGGWRTIGFPGVFLEDGLDFQGNRHNLWMEIQEISLYFNWKSSKNAPQSIGNPVKLSIVNLDFQ